MAKENNKDRILKLLKECKNHQTAESIAVQLNIQRNTASGILNELVREGIVQKEKTRPVIFSYIQLEDQLPEDPFTTFIGADQSLKDAVEKCKLSAGYPNKGMPNFIVWIKWSWKKPFGRVHLPICEIHWNNSRGCPFCCIKLCGLCE